MRLAAGTVESAPADDNSSIESLYRGHRFPPEIISLAVGLYDRFSLSRRDVENLLADRGVTVPFEAIKMRRVQHGAWTVAVR